MRRPSTKFPACLTISPPRERGVGGNGETRRNGSAELQRTSGIHDAWGLKVPLKMGTTRKSSGWNSAAPTRNPM